MINPNTFSAEHIKNIRGNSKRDPELIERLRSRFGEGSFLNRRNDDRPERLERPDRPQRLERPARPERLDLNQSRRSPFAGNK